MFLSDTSAGNGVTATAVKTMSSLKSVPTMNDGQDRALFIVEYGFSFLETVFVCPMSMLSPTPISSVPYSLFPTAI